MSATDELRRMLDERGVEWEDNSPVPSMKPWKTSFTSFTGEEVTLSCYDEPKWIMGTMVFHTPEQAIEATLGRGTCHDSAGEQMAYIEAEREVDRLQAENAKLREELSKWERLTAGIEEDA